MSTYEKKFYSTLIMEHTPYFDQNFFFEYYTLIEQFNCG